MTVLSIDDGNDNAASAEATTSLKKPGNVREFDSCQEMAIQQYLGRVVTTTVTVSDTSHRRLCSFFVVILSVTISYKKPLRTSSRSQKGQQFHIT